MTNFLWPEALWSLLVLPVLAGLYLWSLGRKRRHALHYAHLGLVKQAMGPGPGWRRHVPPVLLGLALLALLLACARPAALITLPSPQQTLLLAMDVSGSMRATDVKPSRIEASQLAAKAFVKGLPRHVRVGVVAFAGTAAVVQAPTLSRDDVIAAIDRFQLQRGTAIGSGIVLSVATLFPEEGIDLSEVSNESRVPPVAVDTAPKAVPAAVPPGSFNSAAVILLTDGQSTTGPQPVDAAKMAADHGVKVYTVGFGTADGEIIGFEGWSMRVRLDEDTLKTIAGLTHAEYYYAGSASDLKKVYDTLSTRLVFERRETEVSALFAALGALLMVLAAGLSLWWFGRVL